MSSEIKQPPVKGGRPPGIPQWEHGGVKANIRLQSLQFDPIGELVKRYRQLEKELQRQEDIRDGIVIERLGNGKARAYRPEVHHAIYDRLIAISDKLLRYGYGRVPEVSITENRPPQALIVNLTKKGEQYVLNDDPAAITEGQPEYTNFDEVEED